MGWEYRKHEKWLEMGMEVTRKSVYGEGSPQTKGLESFTPLERFTPQSSMTRGERRKAA